MRIEPIRINSLLEGIALKPGTSEHSLRRCHYSPVWKHGQQPGDEQHIAAHRTTNGRYGGFHCFN